MRQSLSNDCVGNFTQNSGIFCKIESVKHVKHAIEQGFLKNENLLKG